MFVHAETRIGTVRRRQSLVYVNPRTAVLTSTTTQLLRDIVVCLEHANRKTITVTDVSLPIPVRPRIWTDLIGRPGHLRAEAGMSYFELSSASILSCYRCTVMSAVQAILRSGCSSPQSPAERATLR